MARSSSISTVVSIFWIGVWCSFRARVAFGIVISIRLKEATSLDRLILLENKPPSWNNEAGAYVLNFNGRVTMASVKNFQLCTHDEQHIMQFGRTGNDEFSLDVQWPMSLLQAFAVSLSSFDSKLGCD